MKLFRQQKMLYTMPKEAKKATNDAKNEDKNTKEATEEKK